jgi:hypothetical protein
VQPSSLAITLRRRSPWQAMDLGFAMLRHWWRPVYAAWALVVVPIFALALLAAWLLDKPWVAILLIWWLKPLYDRVVLHVLSHAVFGQLLRVREVLTGARTWLHTALLSDLSFYRFDRLRTFRLPVLQLEGQRGKAARARHALLSRRVANHAVGLIIVCATFETIFLLSQNMLFDLFLPAKADHGRWFWESLGDGGGLGQAFGLTATLSYAAAVSIVEPFFTAAGFALYLNRRAALEGWDIEVALRRIAGRPRVIVRAQSKAAAGHVAALLIAVSLGAVFAFCAPTHALAQQSQKDPKAELQEVLKAPELQTYRDGMQWQYKGSADTVAAPARGVSGFSKVLLAIGLALAKAVEVLLWIAAGVLLVLLLWWLSRMMPRAAARRSAAYRPPTTLFGVELAPETLPDNVSNAALALAREGRMREALSLLYRGALSVLVHHRGVALAASQTEEEALARAQSALAPVAGAYLALLVAAWQRCAYARREPALAELERLAQGYAANFADPQRHGAAGA